LLRPRERGEVRKGTPPKFVTEICNGTAATMEVHKLYYYVILEIGKCELVDETVFERSGYSYTSCRANMGTTLTALLEAVHCCRRKACLAFSTLCFVPVRALIV